MTAPGFVDPPTALVFVDSNVLLYAVDEADRKKREVAREWRAELWKSRRGRLSFQVLGEFPAAAPLKIGIGYAGHTQVLALFDRSVSVDQARTTVDHIAFTIGLSERQGSEALSRTALTRGSRYGIRRSEPE